MSQLTPRKTPVQKRSVVTVSAILQATVQVLEAHGPNGFNTNVVAQRAGVSIGTLYQYFPDKHALIAALSRLHRGGLAEAVEAAVAASRDLSLDAALRSIVHAALMADLERPRFGRMLDVLEAHLPLDGEQAATHRRLSAAIASFLRMRFEASEPVLEAVAEQLRAVTEVLADQMLRQQPAGASTVTDRIAAILLAALPAMLSAQR
jgi:AcrR family transcriptional regulator